MQLYSVLENMQAPAEKLSVKFSEALLNLYDLNSKNLQTDISKQVTETINLMQECINSLQFIDAKYQRIENVADSLGELAEMKILNVNADNRQQWENLDTQVQARYKMLNEREVHLKYFELHDDKLPVSAADIKASQKL